MRLACSKAAATVLALMLTVPTVAPADTLTFDGNICSNNSDGSGSLVPCVTGGYLNQAYGDTAMVNVSYQAGSTPHTLQHWPFANGYSDLTNVAYGYFGAGTASVVLSALGGSAITLNSFSLGSTVGITRSVTVDVVDLATSSIVFTTVATMGATAIQISPGVSSATGLQIIYTGDVFNVAIDNVNFNAAATQPPPSGVPEPSTYALFGLGGLAILASRRLRPGRG